MILGHVDLPGSWGRGLNPFFPEPPTPLQVVGPLSTLKTDLRPSTAPKTSPRSLQSFCQQRLDHFNKTNQKTWCQRFAVDDSDPGNKNMTRTERTPISLLCMSMSLRPLHGCLLNSLESDI